jgi:hypothetical protein
MDLIGTYILGECIILVVIGKRDYATIYRAHGPVWIARIRDCYLVPTAWPCIKRTEVLA